ncbi:MAG: glycosyl transferase [Anaerolineales bacterium]|jgi:cellobiose phosphorylase
MRFGFFDDVNQEYVITQPDTPLPWINYLGCQDFFGIISNTAGGYSFYKDARLRRLTRYRYNNAPLDVGGRCLYVRMHGKSANIDDASWSPTGQPMRGELDAYQCRHGLGYSRITSRKHEVEVDSLFFVPMDQTFEIWRIEVSNRSQHPVELSLFAAVEFCLWDAWDDATNFQRNLSLAEVEVQDNIIYHKTEYRERRNHFAYLACSRPVESYDTQRDAFLGRYRGWDNPEAVEKGHASNSIAHGWQPIGAQQVRLQLQPGQQETVVFLLGYHENPAHEKFAPSGSQRLNTATVRPIIDQYLNPEQVQLAFEELRSCWRDFLANLQVNTPDEHINRMVNTWNAYQVMVTFNLSRSASYFESGVNRGIGFRDSNQDLLGFVQMDPVRARARLLDLAATQLLDGGAYHQYQPLSKRGNDDIGTGFNDDPLWLILAAGAYVRETGDLSLLDERVPYDNEAGTEESLYEHLQRAIGYTLARIGPHGLPLIGRADWNDCLNLNCFSENPGESFQKVPNQDGGVAESVFIAGLFLLAAEEMADLAAHLGRLEERQQLVKAAKHFRAAVDKAGWDGDWFLRAYDHWGKPVGSRKCDEGQIFIETQGICIMAGVGLDNGRAKKALDAVADRLATPHGIMLLQPAFTGYQPRLGEISSYPPGYKENAGIFCHANPWIMIAETMAGNAGRAFEYYMRINPSARQEISELHRCEPYVYAQMIAGRDANRFGEAKNSWLTGTAAWNYVAVTQWILGVRPTLHGLRVRPMIPDDWKGFQMTRMYRGVYYAIEVQRVGLGQKMEMVVDGKLIKDDVIPFPDSDTRRVNVLVNLGR